MKLTSNYKGESALTKKVDVFRSPGAELEGLLWADYDVEFVGHTWQGGSEDSEISMLSDHFVVSFLQLVHLDDGMVVDRFGALGVTILLDRFGERSLQLAGYTGNKYVHAQKDGATAFSYSAKAASMHALGGGISDEQLAAAAVHGCGNPFGGGVSPKPESFAQLPPSDFVFDFMPATDDR